MRRNTLGAMSSAQVNSRGGASSNLTSKAGTKQSRPPAAPNVPKSARPSSLSRRSSIYGKSNQGQTEIRPINDKKFQQDCIETLASYLTSHGYTNVVSQKALLTPSSKDAVSIIQFLFLQVDPNFEIRKLEEDVPLVFKRLGYPVQISRSALYAVGSPLCWPSLLAALSWLSSLLLAMEPSGDGPGDSPFQDNKNKLFEEYIAKGYDLFLNGEDDDCVLLDEKYYEAVEDENEKHAAEVEKLQEAVNEAKDKLRQLKSDPSPLAALQAKKSDYQEDIVKLNTVISNFSSHKQTLERKRDEKGQELAMKEEEVADIARENVDLRETIAAQQINAADVDKMLKEAQILEVTLQGLASRKQELEKAAWDYEIQSSKKIIDLEGIVRQFNGNFERLKVTSGEESLDRPGFEIKLQPRADAPGDVLGGTIKSVIKPGLVAFSDKCRKILADEINPEGLSLQEELFKSEIAIREKRTQISNISAHNRKIEGQHKVMEAKLDTCIREIIAEREELESRMVEEEFVLMKEEAEVQHQLREAEAELQRTVKMCCKEMEEDRSRVTEIMNIILNKKESTELTLKRVEDAARQTIDTLSDLLS